MEYPVATFGSHEIPQESSLDHSLGSKHKKNSLSSIQEEADKPLRRPSSFCIDMLNEQGTSEITLNAFLPENTRQPQALSETPLLHHERNHNKKLFQYLQHDESSPKLSKKTSLTVINQEPKQGQGLTAWISGQSAVSTARSKSLQSVSSAQYYKGRQTNEFQEPRIALSESQRTRSMPYKPSEEPTKEFQQKKVEPPQEEPSRMKKKGTSLRDLFAPLSSINPYRENDLYSNDDGAIDLTSNMLQRHQKKKQRLSILEVLKNPRASLIWKTAEGDDDDDVSVAFSNFTHRRRNRKIIITIATIVLIFIVSLSIALGTGRKKKMKNESMGDSWNNTTSSKAPSPTLAPTTKPSLEPQNGFGAGSPSDTSTSKKQASSNHNTNLSNTNGEKERKRTTSPKNFPTYQPSSPADIESQTPSTLPSTLSTTPPSLSHKPSTFGSNAPSLSFIPSIEPSNVPTKQLSTHPSLQPSSTVTSSRPSLFSSIAPTISPSLESSTIPSSQPTSFVSQQPTVISSIEPSISPKPTPLIWTPLGNDIHGSRVSEQFGESTVISVLSEDQIRVAVATSLNKYEYDSDPSILKGAVYGGVVQVFELRNQNEWVRLGDVFSGEANFGLGCSMAFSKDGTTLVLGSKGNQAALISSFISIYRYEEETWNLEGNFASPDIANISSMSVNVSFDGRRILVATARFGRNGGEIIEINIFDFVSSDVLKLAGSTIVFDSTAFVAVDRQRVRESTQKVNLSTDMSSDGSRFVVGVFSKDFSFVRVYQFNPRSNSWFQLMGAIPCKPSAVALSGDGTVFAIGISTATERKGQVRIYMVKGPNRWFQFGNFLQQPHREHPQVSSLCFSYSDAFGHSVALSREGLRIVVGAPGRCDSLSTHNELNGGLHGEVFSYQYDQRTSSWVMLSGNENKEDWLIGEAEGDRYGYSVSISEEGETMAVGAISNDEGGVNSGNVNVYTRI